MNRPIGLSGLRIGGHLQGAVQHLPPERGQAGSCRFQGRAAALRAVQHAGLLGGEGLVGDQRQGVAIEGGDIGNGMEREQDRAQRPLLPPQGEG